MTSLVEFLRGVAASHKREHVGSLVDEILTYESRIDGEWGCRHQPADIGAGNCREIDPDEITALRLLASFYEKWPGYNPEWANIER